MIVAEITKDVLFEKWNSEGTALSCDSNVGRQFDSETLREWWGWGMKEGTPEDTYFHLAESNNGKTSFKLYDDDDELYYEGWLIDDDESLVQEFVLTWAKTDSGCTSIMVQKDGKYVQVIG